MVLRVTQYGEPVLRMTGETVTVFDASLAGFAQDMIDTMFAAEGVGLAAQQVGRPIRVFVIDVSHLPPQDLEYRLDGLRPPIDLIMPLVLVNPELKQVAGDVVWGEEGCLSFPGIRCEVPRAQALEVRYQDLAGNPHWLQCSGWFARVIQHEADHLEGVLFIDRTAKRARRNLEHKLRQLKSSASAELDAQK